MKQASTIQLVECPRDAMQGWKKSISTEQKANYMNALLQVGFHTLDFGSFVSPKLIPQMADTAEVLNLLDWKTSSTKLLAIVANRRGAEQACAFEGVHYLGYPFSISATFQKRNTNSTPNESFSLIEDMHELCIAEKKELVVYLSMAFGNPYGDPYGPKEVLLWAKRCNSLGIGIISLADTVGLAGASQVGQLVSLLTHSIQGSIIGVHLHSNPLNRKEKIDAAWNSGCRRFDGALGGYGGCPMAGDELVANVDSYWMIEYLKEKDRSVNFNDAALEHCASMAREIFA